MEENKKLSEKIIQIVKKEIESGKNKYDLFIDLVENLDLYHSQVKEIMDRAEK